MIKITSVSNPTIKMIRSLYKKKHRLKRKMFIIEGVKIVEECIDNNYPIENILYSDDLFNIQGGESLFNKIKNDERLINVPEKLYGEISDMETPQGILAVSKIQDNDIDDINVRNNQLVLLLDRIRDPGNIGTIIRTADAFGIDGIITTDGCVDVYNSKVIRATMGSIFRIPIYNGGSGTSIINKLKGEDIKIYVTTLKKSINIQEIDFNKPCVIVIGNESTGVSQDILDLADIPIKIPMLGGAESLNAGVASSIIMYEAIRQRTR